MCHPLIVDLGDLPLRAGLHLRQARALERAARVAALHVPLRRSHGVAGVCEAAPFWAEAGFWPHMFDFFAKLEGSGEILATGRYRYNRRA